MRCNFLMCHKTSTIKKNETEKKQEIKNQGLEKGLQMKRKHVKCVKIHWHKMCKIDTVANLGSAK